MIQKPLIYRWKPEWGVNSISLFPLGGAVGSRSKYTGTLRAASGANSYWTATIRLTRRHEKVWREIRPFIAKLNGAQNQVRLYDAACILPLGAAAGSNRDNYRAPGTIKFSDDTAFSDGTQFADGSTKARLARTHREGEGVALIKGLKPSQPVSLAIDDMLEIGGFLHMATASVRSDAQGRALVPIFPALRVDVPQASTKAIVNFAYASSTFTLARPFEGFDVRYRNFADDMTFEFIEALP